MRVTGSSANHKPTCSLGPGESNMIRVLPGMKTQEPFDKGSNKEDQGNCRSYSSNPISYSLPREFAAATLSATKPAIE